MNRDVKIGIVVSILVFLVLVLYWSTRGSKEVTPSSLEEEGIALVDVDKPEWQQRFEEERDAIVEIGRPPVEVEQSEEGTPEFIEPLPSSMEEEPGPEKKVTPLRKRTHIVQKGDNLWKLAKKYYGDGSKWQIIHEANKAIIRRTTALKVGLEIIIPEPVVAPEEKAEGPSLESLGKRTYVIKRGDFLWNLAIKFYGDGTKWQIIYEANKTVIPNPTLLPVGKKIVIPDVAPGEAVSTNT